MNNLIFFFFHNLAHQFVFMDKIIIFLADTLPYVVILLVLIYLVLSKKNWKDFFKIFFTAGLAWFLAYLLKLLIQTDRPFVLLENVRSLFYESGYAFPSGHTTFFTALAFAIFFNDKKIGCLFIFLALLIGLARIAAGVHFPVDILGGFLLGCLIAFLFKNV